MNHEFTGERVVPGEVDPDLWNEHLSRYAFAARLARRKRVLDIGCGAGYGACELASTAVHVTAIDSSADAVAYAEHHYQRENLTFQTASAILLPFPDASFDLIVAFEVIEHLEDWRAFLKEAARALSPYGQLVVSTPNKEYYAETRRLSGPNPFHIHEFEYPEFVSAVSECFPHILMFTQNHANSLVFRPVLHDAPPMVEVRLEGAAAAPAEAHFFIAVCANQLMTGAPAFLYLPTAGNVLRERELHIRRLAAELETKEIWLSQSQQDHSSLVDLHARQTAELEARNRWAEELNEKVTRAGLRIHELQQELEIQEASSRTAVMAYENEIARLNEDLGAVTARSQLRESELLEQLNASQADYSECLKNFQNALANYQSLEVTVEERTTWAQSLDSEIVNLERQLQAIRTSRWMELGRRIGLGPRVA